MSVRARLVEAESAGRLRRYVSDRSRNTSRRRLFLTHAGQRDYDNPSSAVNLLVGRGFVEAAFDRWTLGGRIFGNKKGGIYLKRLDPPPDEIWEIRVTDPRPQARVLCRFAEMDTLVVTGMYTRDLLGKRGSSNWNNSMQACVAEWQSALGTLMPLRGNHINAYVGENFDDFPL